MGFELLEDLSDGVSWDSLIQGFRDYTIYQSSGWAKYKNSCGWDVLRLIYRVNGQIKGAGQGFLKRNAMLGIRFYWFPAGILFKNEGGSDSFLELPTFLNGFSGEDKFYARLKFPFPISEKEVSLLKKAEFSRLRKGVGSEMTLRVNTGLAIDKLENRLSSNWGHNLKRSQKKENSFYEDTTPEGVKLFFGNYRIFCKKRGIKNEFSEFHIEGLFDNFSKTNNIHIFFAKNGRSPAAGRLVLTIGKRAFDTVAFTTETGRKLYSSYYLLWEIIKSFQEKGFEFFDLSGIDMDKFRSIYNFKKGLGADLVNYGGEWEFSNNRLLRKAASVYSFLRRD